MDSELLTCPNPEIAPEDWQRTLPSVQQMILQMAQRLAALEQKVSTLRAEFVCVEDIEPTNNAAERARQSAVIWRRTSLGTQSAEGSQFVARMLTVVLTLRAQQRNVLAYLTTACEAAR